MAALYSMPYTKASYFLLRWIKLPIVQEQSKQGAGTNRAAVNPRLQSQS
ncbi:MAG: hypothetical protein ACKOOL_06185 [Novosphingobium sp.]